MSAIEDIYRFSGRNKSLQDAGTDDEETPIEVGPTEHRLQYTYGLWYSGKTNYMQYDSSLRKVGRFASVEQFWALYSHLVRPSEFPMASDFYIFKDKIKPMWEDPTNREGGHWLVRLNKGLAARCWENLILAVLGEQFDVGDEICGAGVTMRPKKDCISIWNKTSHDPEVTERIRDTLRKVLNLPTHIQMEYRYHKDYINWINQRDGSGKSQEGQGDSAASGGAPGFQPRTPTTPGTPGGGFSKRPGSPPSFYDRERDTGYMGRGGGASVSGGGFSNR